MAVRSMAPTSFHRKRIAVAFLITLGCYLNLVVKLLYLQGVDGSKLSKISENNRKKTETILPARGSILDSAGKPLANSIYSGEIWFNPREIASQKNLSPKAKEKLFISIDKSLTSAASILQIPRELLAEKIISSCSHFAANSAKSAPVGDSSVPIEDSLESQSDLRTGSLAEKIHQACIVSNRKAKFQYVLIKKDAPLECALAVKSFRPRLLGFGVRDGSKRMYPTGKNAAQVVGFMSSKGVGVSGLEKSLNDLIKGKPGETTVEKDDYNREIPDTAQFKRLVEDGPNVETTIDSTAQNIAADAAEKIIQKYDPKGVSIVIIDPITGDIKAMVSAPTFDPNPGQHPHITLDEQWERCSTMLFEPGSTLKAVTICGALDSGDIDENSQFHCSGSLKVANKIIHCALHGKEVHTGHGTLTPRGILRQSCNVGAAEIGMRMGPRRLYLADIRFGILSKLDISIPREQMGRLSFNQKSKNAEKIYTISKAARVAFGHSVVTTPVHMTMAYGAIANKGILMKPRLVTTLTLANGKVVKSCEPTPAGRAASEKTSEKVRSMLCGVVSAGTGTVAAIPGYIIAGKTGTAAKYLGKGYYASFVGFLPASPNAVPRAVILVGVDEPKNGHFGAEVAAPAFHDIAMRLMQVWHVPQDDPSSSQLKSAWAKTHSKTQNRLAMNIPTRH